MFSYAVLSVGAILVGGVAFIVSAIAMQEVRSRLVNVLTLEKPSMAPLVSDWSISGGRLPGHYQAIKKEFIWGQSSVELLGLPATAGLVRMARRLYVIREAARYIGLVGLVAFAAAFALCR
jgi:hypothetical protein